MIWLSNVRLSKLGLRAFEELWWWKTSSKSSRKWVECDLSLSLASLVSIFRKYFYASAGNGIPKPGAEKSCLNYMPSSFFLGILRVHWLGKMYTFHILMYNFKIWSQYANWAYFRRCIYHLLEEAFIRRSSSIIVEEASSVY